MVMFSPSRSAVRENAPKYDAGRPPPSANIDLLFDLGERIANLAASINAAKYEMLTLLAEFDAGRGWEPEGFGSCAEWFAWRTGIKAGAARERVRAALALQDLPQTAAAMARGELSFTKVRALTRVATEESEGALLELARAGSAAHLERTLRSWRHLSEKRQLGLDNFRHNQRRFSIYVDDDGMYVVQGRLEPEIGALLMRAVDAASDALFRTENAPEPNTDRGAALARTEADSVHPRQRRADAVGLLAERAISAGFRTGEAGTSGRVSGSRADRYQVIVHVGAETLGTTAETEATADLEPTSHESRIDTVGVSAETSQRMCCDAAVVVMSHAPDGAIVSVGRKTRTVPPALRRALEARDQRCRFPGCDSRFTDGHHLVHWTRGGETSLKNLLLLCPRHHRAVHEGGTRVVRGNGGEIAFFAPNGRVMFDAPATDRTTADSTPRTVARDWADLAHLARNTHLARNDSDKKPAPVWRTGGPRYNRNRDIPWTVEARAREAAD